jgi:amino acid permease
LVVVGAICLFAFHLLFIVQQQTGGNYGEIAKHLYGNWLCIIIDSFLVISQMGFVSSYLIFISENLGIVVNALSDCHAPFKPEYFIWIVLIAIIPITWVKRIERLSILMIIADVFIAFGLISILYFASTQISQHGVGNNIMIVNKEHFALMVGTAVFSFEGIGTILPIANGMRDPTKFPRVMNIGMLIVLCILSLVGTIGYLAYGDTTQASVASNLPQSPLSTTVQLLYACAIILSAPLILYPAVSILETYAFRNCTDNNNVRTNCLKKLGRAIIVVVCASVSFGVGPANLDKFVSMVGSIACIPLVFHFPPMFHNKITQSRFAKSINYMLIILGFIIMGYTMYVSVNAWIHPTASARVVIDVNHCDVPTL